MKFTLHAAAAVILAASLVVSHAQTSGSAPTTKKHVAGKKVAAPAGPTVQEQIQALRVEMQGQIDSLKEQISTKDEQVKAAQDAAASAQAAAAKAEADATAQQQAFTENTTAVSTLQSTVKDLTANQASLADTVSTETTSIKKAVNNPDTIHYKGVTLSPAGSFIAGETVYRTAAADSGINTAFTGIPLQSSEAYQLSEFYGTGRQSRVALTAVGKLANMTMTGHWEADWLSAGADSNNNQSNSYTMRQRVLYGEAKTAGGWDVSAGTGWDLVAETTQGLTRGTEILPATIDAQYEPGFAWTRQFSFRVTKDFGKTLFAGISVENAETLNPGGQNLPTDLLVGAAGAGGGHFNAGANYSFNLTPDFVAKIAVEPGWGHWELFGIGRSFRDRIYPLFPVAYPTAAAFDNTAWGGGIGGGFRGPLFDKKVTVGLKGLWGQGVGRYGSSTIADITLRPDGTISPLHGFSALSTVELNPTSRLNLYFNYGGDYISRDWVLDKSGYSADPNNGKEVGYGAYTAVMSGCNTEPASSSSFPASDPTTPSNCAGNNKDVQEFTAGYWFNIHNGPQGRLRQGIQYSLMRRDLWSGTGSTTAPVGGIANPNGGAHGDDNMIFTSFRYYLP